jgi:hypothetical protein
MIPIQEQVMALQFRVGRKFMRWTDQRAKLLLEVLGAMRVVKYFSYEKPFLKSLFGSFISYATFQWPKFSCNHQDFTKLGKMSSRVLARIRLHKLESKYFFGLCSFLL